MLNLFFTRPCLTAVLACLLLSACTSAKPHPENPRQVIAGPTLNLADISQEERMRIDTLEVQLNHALGHASPESRALAELSVLRALELRRDYDIRVPRLMHNLMVNIGMAPRGLCCDWARDLLDRIESRPWNEFRFVWGVARYQQIGEHSSVVAIAPGKSFSEGILLDGWRDQGLLYFSVVQDDPEYDWMPHPDFAPGVRINCKQRGRTLLSEYSLNDLPTEHHTPANN